MPNIDDSPSLTWRQILWLVASFGVLMLAVASVGWNGKTVALLVEIVILTAHSMRTRDRTSAG